MSLDDPNDPIANAAGMNHRDDLTPEQLELATQKKYMRLWEQAANPAVDTHPTTQKAEATGEKGAEYWALTDPWSMNRPGNALWDVAKAILGPVMSFLNADNTHGDAFALERYHAANRADETGAYPVDTRYLSEPGRYDETYVPVEQRDKLGYASADLAAQLAKAASTHDNINDEPAPTIEPKVG